MIPRACVFITCFSVTSNANNLIGFFIQGHYIGIQMSVESNGKAIFPSLNNGIVVVMAFLFGEIFVFLANVSTEGDRQGSPPGLVDGSQSRRLFSFN